MTAIVRCPICGNEQTMSVSIPNISDNPFLTVDDQDIYDTTSFECYKCKKELSIQITIKLFE